MRAVIQRVSQANVTVEGQITGQIGAGLLVLLGVAPGDSQREIDWMAEKLVGLRVFEDAEGKMNLSLADVEGGMLVVSQFTLYGDCRKGRRPSFVDAAPPEHAEAIYEQFAAAVAEKSIPVGTGKFRHHMEVSLLNDGPVTLIIDSP